MEKTAVVDAMEKTAVVDAMEKTAVVEFLSLKPTCQGFFPFLFPRKGEIEK